jgi:hypothetical protein
MSIPVFQSKAKRHWQQWLPQRTRELRAAGQFESETLAAARMAQDEVESLMQAGYEHHEAEEVALHNHLLLPPEEDAREAPWEREELARRAADYMPSITAGPLDD